MKMISHWWTQLLEKLAEGIKTYQIGNTFTHNHHMLTMKWKLRVGEPTNMVASLAKKVTGTGTVDEHIWRGKWTQYQSQV